VPNCIYADFMGDHLCFRACFEGFQRFWIKSDSCSVFHVFFLSTSGFLESWWEMVSINTCIFVSIYNLEFFMFFVKEIIVMIS